jgi:hypothetical protein
METGKMHMLPPDCLAMGKATVQIILSDLGYNNDYFCSLLAYQRFCSASTSQENEVGLLNAYRKIPKS